MNTITHLVYTILLNIPILYVYVYVSDMKTIKCVIHHVLICLMWQIWIISYVNGGVLSVAAFNSHQKR